METIYRKGCGCTFRILKRNDAEGTASVQFIDLCKMSEKDNVIRQKYMEKEDLSFSDIKLSDLEDAVKGEKIAIDTIETIKTMDKEIV